VADVHQTAINVDLVLPTSRHTVVEPSASAQIAQATMRY
jgi:hypothetical protein